jgi:hypothetical protein
MEDKDRDMSFLLKRAAWVSVLAFVLASFAAFVLEFHANAPAHFPLAYMHEDCGPTDGIAIQLYFTLKATAQCGKYSEPFLHIEIYQFHQSESTDYPIGRDSRVVVASRCLRPGQCESATSGTLHLEKYVNGKGASGQYKLRFPDGSVEKGRFDAAWCHFTFMCG